MAILAVLAGGAGWRARRNPGAARLLLVAPDAGPGLSDAEADSVGSLLQDELELRSSLPVTALGRLPEGFQPADRTLVLRPTVSREGVRLILSLAWEDWRSGERSPRSRGASAGQDEPSPAFERALGGLPLSLGPAPQGFLPATAEAFWSLVRADADGSDYGALEPAVASANRLAQAEPACATAQVVLSHLETLRVLQDPQPFNGHAALALAAADRAAAEVPGYPRALRYGTRLLADQGRQEEAFPRLADGLRRRPQALTLLLALDYCARTAGLMEVAAAARQRLGSLWAGSPVPPPVAFTELYRGHTLAFLASLRGDPSEPPDSFATFYLGYGALLQGRRDQAELRFREAIANPATEAHFRTLAQIYLLGIEGDFAGARRALESLDRSRVGLQVPDGEFTLSMAEAAAFLGEEGRAMDLAQRAFSQGFTCSDWYRGSPLLAPLQGLPRWRALLQHVDSRRARLAAQHQAGEFGL